MAESSDDIKKWIEWKEKCALDLCCDETRRFLGKQAEKKFYGFLYSEAKGELIYTRPERYEAWHLFETHCCVKVNKKFNKNYKVAPCGSLDGVAIKVLPF